MWRINALNNPILTPVRRGANGKTLASAVGFSATENSLNEAYKFWYWGWGSFSPPPHNITDLLNNDGRIFAPYWKVPNNIHDYSILNHFEIQKMPVFKKIFNYLAVINFCFHQIFFSLFRFHQYSFLVFISQQKIFQLFGCF